MIMAHRISILLFVMVAYFLFLPLSAGAAAGDFKLQVPIGGLSEITLCDGHLDGSMTCEGITKFIVAIYEWLIRAAVIAGMLVFVIAGIAWMSARGNTEQTKKAQDLIKDTLVGLALALGSYTLLWAISPQLVTLNPFESQKIDMDVHKLREGMITDITKLPQDSRAMRDVAKFVCVDKLEGIPIYIPAISTNRNTECKLCGFKPEYHVSFRLSILDGMPDPPGTYYYVKSGSAFQSQWSDWENFLKEAQRTEADEGITEKDLEELRMNPELIHIDCCLKGSGATPNPKCTNEPPLP